jgi:glucose-6-phosphate isomerase
MADLALDLKHAQLDAPPPGRAALLREALQALDRSPQGEFLRVPHDRALLRELRAFAAARPAGLTDVVQLGIGGSSLGAQALCSALLDPDHNERVRRPGVRVHFPDNVDPEVFGALLERLDPRKTLVHVVSKSGGTLETEAQLSALIRAFGRSSRSARARGHFVVTTGASGSLRAFAERERLPILRFPEGVAGRYSVFTASGLLVPALAGVRIERLLGGARRAERLAREDEGLGLPGRLAALHFEHDRTCGRRIHVEFVYADALLKTAEWFRQIWAESLGKSGSGPTPVVARGTTDQHSQLQLYMEGPDDKLYTFLRVERFRRRVRLGAPLQTRALAGASLERVLAAEAEGTHAGLVGAARPVIALTLRAMTPELLGQLLFVKQLQTALAGALYGVDPFTQPGVQAGKETALRILSSGNRRG